MPHPGTHHRRSTYLTLWALALALVWIEGPVAPTWVLMIVAALLLVAGTLVFWTPARERSADAAPTTAALLTMAALVLESRANRRDVEPFPVWLFWSVATLGIGWCLRFDQCATRRRHRHDGAAENA